MARVTVEDCLENVSNRFDLVIMASRRARQLTGGSEPTLETNNDKMTVMALREIGENTIDLNALMVEEKKQQSNDETETEIKTDAEAKALMAEETQIPGVNLETPVDAKPANDTDPADVVEAATGDLPAEE